MIDCKTRHGARLLYLAVAITTTLSTTSFAGALEDAFTDGKASVNARYRYETVDDSTNKDATAGTLRTRLGFTTSEEFDLSMLNNGNYIVRIMNKDQIIVNKLILIK